MDPNKVKLIDLAGVETEHSLVGVLKGEAFPLVLVKIPGRVGVPSQVYTVDNGEVAKRFWTEMVYRETTALYI